MVTPAKSMKGQPRAPRSSSTPRLRSPYTAAQWSAIELAAQRARAVPLTEGEKDWLCRMAAIYRRGPEIRQQRREEERLRKGWRKLVAMCDQAANLLTSLDYGSDGSYDDFRERNFVRPIRWLRSLRERAESFSIDSLDEELRGMLPKKLARAATRKPNARLLFESLVVDFWEQIGGKAATSWDPVNERVFGPFVVFFEAVARPVMKSNMPSLRSLQDIVRREKLIREAFREFDHMDVNSTAPKILHM
jgi:hypothetical protein